MKEEEEKEMKKKLTGPVGKKTETVRKVGGIKKQDSSKQGGEG